MSSGHNLFGGNRESKMKQGRFVASGDYDALIELALIMKDKQWFEELVKKKQKLRQLEEEVRNDLGFVE